MGVLGLAVTTLLVGARFGFMWAGGTGYVAPVPVIVTALNGHVTVDHFGKLRDASINSPLSRGEIVHVDDGYGELKIDGSTLSMAARTDVELVSLTPDKVEVRVQRGRIALEHALNTNRILIDAGPGHLSLGNTGWLSVVHYDFRGTVTIAPMGATVSAEMPGLDALTTSSPFSYVYWNTPHTTDAAFDASSGSTAPFYTRFLTTAGLPLK